MITRIEIDGFKAFSQFALDLEPFVVLIGPNGAGKSNLLDALGLLGRLSGQDFASAFAGGRGRISEQFVRSPAPAAPTWIAQKGVLALAVEFLLLDDSVLGIGERIPLQSTRLRYELNIELAEIEGGLQRIQLRRERLSNLQPDADPWMDRHPQLRRYARYAEGGDILAYNKSHLAINDPSARDQAIDAIVQYVPSGAYLSPRSSAVGRSPHLLAVGSELAFQRLYHLDPEALRTPSERGARLLPSGANLPTALAAMPASEQAHVRADFAALVPGIRGFEVVPEGDRLEVEVELLDGQRFSSRTLSEGTLRMLGLASMVRLSPPGHLIAVEEPENGVHPARLRILVERLRWATLVSNETDEPSAEPPRQILLTTHSLVVLASALQHPDETVFFDMVRRGQTRTTRARRLAPQGATDRGEYFVSATEIERLLDAGRSDLAGEV